MASTTVKQRDPNLDFIRCIALFFVMAVHFCTHCNIYNAGYTGLAAYITEFLRTMYVPALALFLMLNGYFQNRKKLTARYYLGILKLLEMYILCAVLNMLYSHFYIGQPLDLRTFFSGIVNFTASEYSWYVLLYAGLFLMIPFLNLIYNSLSCQGHKRILIFSFLFLSSLPFSFLNAFTGLYCYWWQRIWPITFYFMGAYVAEFRPRLSGKRWGLILLAVLVVFAGYNYFFYHEDSPLFGIATRSFLYAHEGLQNAVLTPLVFLFALDVKLDKCPKPLLRFMKAVSDYSYGAFLFSSITDSFVYIWLNRWVPVIGRRYLFFIVALPISYMSAVGLSAAFDRVIRLVDKVIRPIAERLINWFYKLLAPDAAE